MESKPIKILLVEDDQDDYVIVLDYICRMKRSSYQLDWICSFDDALEAIARREHDVCVLDYSLGPDSGLDLLREIRANGYDLPVIMLTRHHRRDLETVCRQAGANAFLVKSDADAAHLEEAIQAALVPKGCASESS